MADTRLLFLSGTFNVMRGVRLGVCVCICREKESFPGGIALS